MDRKTQIGIVGALTTNIREEIITKIEAGKIPENWDGFELRELVAEKARAESYHKSMTDKRSARRRAYDKTIIANNI